MGYIGHKMALAATAAMALGAAMGRGQSFGGVVGNGHNPKSTLPAVREVRANPKFSRGAAKKRTRGAVNDLVAASQAQTVVLNHIHPRWLRAEVERRMDLGETITEQRIDELRAIGAGRS